MLELNRGIENIERKSRCKQSVPEVLSIKRLFKRLMLLFLLCSLVMLRIQIFYHQVLELDLTKYGSSIIFYKFPNFFLIKILSESHHPTCDKIDRNLKFLQNFKVSNLNKSSTINLKLKWVINQITEYICYFSNYKFN